MRIVVYVKEESKRLNNKKSKEHCRKRWLSKKQKIRKRRRNQKRSRRMNPYKLAL